MKFTQVFLLCLPSLVFALPTSANTVSKLSADEAASLQFMREEEKLAYDVYSHLFAIHKDRPFANISSAESRHTNAIIGLMQTYGVEDSGASQKGRFNHPELQALYDRLIALGESSREMAFMVGIIIEETDIADLDESIRNTRNPDLIRVYENLRAGSYRHLDAFTSGLKRLSDDPETVRQRAMRAISGSDAPAA